MDRMQIYQHVLNSYVSAQKSGKKVDLPPSVDKIVGILQEVPDKHILHVIEMLVACESEPKVLEAMQKLFRERGLGGKAGTKSQSHSDSGKDLVGSASE